MLRASCKCPVLSAVLAAKAFRSILGPGLALVEGRLLSVAPDARLFHIRLVEIEAGELRHLCHRAWRLASMFWGTGAIPSLLPTA